MRNSKKLLLITFLSLLITLTIANAAEKFEIGGQIFFFPQSSLFLFGINGGVEVVPQFAIRGYAAFGSSSFSSGGYYYTASLNNIGVDALYKIGEGKIKPYLGAGFSQLSASISGISVGVSFINFIGGVSTELTEKLNLFAEVRYALPMQSGIEGEIIVSSGINYLF